MKRPAAPARPLTPMQEGMLFHSISSPGTGVEIEQILCTSREPLDVSALAEAWRFVVDRHDVLRTRFRWEGLAAPVQEVLPELIIPVELDVSAPDPAALLEADRRIDFDPHEACMRIRVVPGGDEWRMLWSFHHAILDGRSFPIVLRDLFDAYGGLRRGEVPGREERSASYGDFVDHVTARDHEVSRSYWEGLLRGVVEAEHPLIESRVRGNSGDFGAIEMRLDPDVAGALRVFASEQGVTLNTLLQAAWSITLSNHTRAHDVVFGATRACRHVPVAGAQEMVGLLINTVPMRAAVRVGSVSELLTTLRHDWMEQRDHELTPLTSIQRWAGVGGSLFDSIAVFDGAELRDRLRTGGEWLDRDFEYRGRTGYPLTLIGYDGGSPLLRLEHDRALVGDERAAQLLDETVRALTAFPQSRATPPLRVPVLRPEHRASALALAAPRRVISSPGTVTARIIGVAAAQPEAPAVKGPGGSLTYGELDQRSARFAGALLSRGVSASARVGVMLDRSVDAVVAMLGVMRAGACYVPLDPDSPVDRVRFIAGDADLAMVVTDRAEGLPGVSCMSFDSLRQGPLTTVAPAADDGAYIIYTSGSTGRPKGVEVTHANVTRLLDSCGELFEFRRDDVWSCFHSFAFDFSVWEIWCALMTGASVIVAAREEILAPDRFAGLLARERVTILSQTPSAFRALQSEILSQPGAALQLRYVVFGGEALEPRSLRSWIERFGDREPALINMYGITETTVHVTSRRISAADTRGDASPIGLPLPDLGVLLVNTDGAFAPIGAPGEMYVAGGGVTCGYLNRPELTAERFVETELVPGMRFYRSGDIARRCSTGELEFLGRADSQVKVRGHRIEPGEIEEALRQHPAIRDARVIPKKQGAGRDLAAYFTMHGAAPMTSELREHLQRTLPTYMVPKWFVPVSAIPLTANGKLDTAALPDPEPLRDASAEFVEPVSVLEQSIAEVWREVLHVPRVGTRDNFFDLGGNSLLLVRVAGRLRERLARPIEIIMLFAYPTVEALARHLSTAETDDVGRYAEIAARAARQRSNFLTSRKS